MIRHLVYLRFSNDIETNKKQALYARLNALVARINGILDFQHRENVSIETPLVRGFLDMFWFDFQSADTRDAYLVDAEHQAIGTDIVACLEGKAEGVFVCDIKL